MFKQLSILTIIGLLLLSGCIKDDKYVPNNNAPNYYGVPTIKVKNYVNRLFIDLVGREPLDTEMDSLVSLLEANNLNHSTREQIILNLQYDTITQTSGDSFKYLYFLRIYELQKARFVEGIPDSEFSGQIGIKENAAYLDSLYGDLMGYQYNKQQAQLYRDVINSFPEYMGDSITFNEMCIRMCFNGIYDQINMNSFNYINAVFDNTFYRFPTQSEFTASYDMVEYGQANIVFGLSGSSKYDFVNICMNSQAFNDGTVSWIYKTFLARNPTQQELYAYSLYYEQYGNLHYIIRELMKTDEYANF